MCENDKELMDALKIKDDKERFEVIEKIANKRALERETLAKEWLESMKEIKKISGTLFYNTWEELINSDKEQDTQ